MISNSLLARQFPINLISNVINFTVKVGIGIFLAPFLIAHLGIEGYGLIPLITSLTNYWALITLPITSAVARYLTIDLQRNDLVSANISFNSALFVVSAASITVILPLSFFAGNLPAFFDVPKSFVNEISMFFIAILLSVLIGNMSSVFSVSSLANNRIDLYNWAEILNHVIKVSLIVFLLTLFSPSLICVGIAYFIGTLFAWGFNIVVWTKLTPGLCISARAINSSRLKEFMSYGGWIVLDQIGTLLFLYTDIMLVNIFLGSISSGQYALGLQFSSLMWSLAGVFAGLFTPIILIYYAKQNEKEIVRVTKMAIQFTGLIMALPIGLLCGFAPEVVTLWVGNEYASISPLIWLLNGHLVINLALLPIFAINRAYNKVKIPALATIAAGILNLILAVGLIKYNFGIYGVALAGMITLSLRNLGVITGYAAIILNIPKTTFIYPLLPGAVSAISILIVSLTIKYYYVILSWSDIIGSCILISLIFSAILWYLPSTAKYRITIKAIFQR
jgi:membrane protein EpsK